MVHDTDIDQKNSNHLRRLHHKPPRRDVRGIVVLLDQLFNFFAGFFSNTAFVVDDAGNGARGNARSGCNVVNCHKSCPVCCKGLQTSLRLEMQRKSWNAGWVVCFVRVLWSKHTAEWTYCSGNSCDLHPLYHIGVDSTRELFRIFEFFAIDFIKRFQMFLKSWRKFKQRIGKTA